MRGVFYRGGRFSTGLAGLAARQPAIHIAVRNHAGFPSRGLKAPRGDTEPELSHDCARSCSMGAVERSGSG